MTVHDPYKMFFNPYTTHYRRICTPALTLAEIGNQFLGHIIESNPTPEQFEQLQQRLLHIYKELEKQTGPLHYAATFGPPHTCLKDIYLHTAAILRNRAILQQAPPPPPAQQLISREGTAIDLEERVETSSEETELGSEDSR